MTKATDPLPNLNEWVTDFERFHDRFADLFARSEQRERSKLYLRGLLGGVERRNGWQLAEAIGEDEPHATQRLLSEAHWSAAAARDRLLDFSIEHFGDPEGIAILDETGFLKQGTHSVGVARQYTGTAGKIENCQVGVFLAYASRHGHVLLDRGLYLPRGWTDDRARGDRAHVPSAVTFRTKPTLARRLLTHAVRRGVPVKWVTGDEVYGNNPALRTWLARQPYRFVLAVQCNLHVWPTRPEVEPPATPGARGRPRTHPVVKSPSVRVDALVKTWPSDAWTRLVVHEGEKGPIEYDWAARRVVDKLDEQPGEARWLLVRRSIHEPIELAYYLSDASAETPLATLAHVASTRYVIEQCLGEAKDDVGMDQYEVRSWTGWYRFITLCMMAVAWVASVRKQIAQRESPTPPSSRKDSAKKGGLRPVRPGRSPRSGAFS